MERKFQIQLLHDSWHIQIALIFVCAHVEVWCWDQAAANVPDWITSEPDGLIGNNDYPQLPSQQVSSCTCSRSFIQVSWQCHAHWYLFVSYQRSSLRAKYPACFSAFHCFVAFTDNRGVVTVPICDQKVPSPDCATLGGSLLVKTKRKNCLLTMVPSDEASPSVKWEEDFNTAAEQLVKASTNFQHLPFSVSAAALDAAYHAHYTHGYIVRATMVAPHDSMGYAGAASVWYQSNVATQQIDDGDGGALVVGPRLAVAFLRPAV